MVLNLHLRSIISQQRENSRPHANEAEQIARWHFAIPVWIIQQ
jgi:hypothetical protein